MAYDFNGTDQYLTVASAPVTVTPLTLVARFNPNNVTANCILLQLINSEGNERYLIAVLGGVAGDPVRAAVNSNSPQGSSSNADSTAGYQSSVWQHAGGVFASSTSRTVYLDGGNSATATDSITASSISKIDIGARLSSGSYGIFMDGKLSDLAIWNVALTDAEIASLAKGFKPTRIRPQSLVFYAPLIRDLQDVKGGLTITNNNSATVANHPRVY